MSKKATLCWLALFLALAVVGGGLLEQQENTPTRTDGTVVRIVDGDTAKIRLDGRTETVRYIGIDTPETKKPNTPVQCFGHAASNRNEELVDNKSVRLRFDRERRDRYGRLLAYIYRKRDGLFVNRTLVEGGYARAFEFPPNTSHASELRRAEARAARKQRGLWGSCH